MTYKDFFIKYGIPNQNDYGAVSLYGYEFALIETNDYDIIDIESVLNKNTKMYIEFYLNNELGNLFIPFKMNQNIFDVDVNFDVTELYEFFKEFVNTIKRQEKINEFLNVSDSNT